MYLDNKEKVNTYHDSASSEGKLLPEGKIGGQGKKKDAVTSLVFADNRNFAEVFNHTVFASHPVPAESLREDSIKETAMLQVTETTHTILTRYRDVVKELKEGQQLVILGIENQELQNYQMPFRVMEMDFLNYARQIRMITDRNFTEMKRKEEGGLEVQREDFRRPPTSSEYLSRFYKEDRLNPCITLVIYWGSEPWQGPRRLSDMFSESEWSPFASDYGMHLLEVQQISDQELDSYNDELKVIFGFVKYASQKDRLLNYLDQHQDAFACVSETAVNAIAELTHSPEIKRVRTEGHAAEGRTFDMCQAIREMIEDGRKEERRYTEQERIRAEQERIRAEQERMRADTAEQKICQLQEEIRRLRIQYGLSQPW